MNRSRHDLDVEIRRLFAQIFVMHSESPDAPDLNENTNLLETGLDSLGYAVLVTRLEEELGYDPFSLSAKPFYPRTYGEFLSFYDDHQP